MLRRFQERPLLWILAGAFLIRLLCVPVCHLVDYTADEKEYLLIARNIADKGILVDSEQERSKRPPLFPLTLAGIAQVGGEGLLLPHVIFCIIGALVVWGTYVLTERLLNDRDAAILAASAMALYPSAVIYSALLQTEILFTAFMLATLLAGYRTFQTRLTAPAVLMGIAAACAALTRAVFLGVFPFLLASFAWLHRGHGKEILRPIATACLSFCLVILPWTLRNYEVHDAFVPISTWSGRSLLIANNPFATGTWSVKPGFDKWLSAQLSDRGLPPIEDIPEAERDGVSRSIALAYMTGHPLETASLTLTRAHMFWIYPVVHTDSYLPVQALALGADILLFLGAAIGTVLIRGHADRFLPLMVVVAVLCCTHIILQAEARYRLPLSPFLCMFFGGGMSLARGIRDASEQRIAVIRAAIAGGVVIVIVYGYTGWLFLTHRIS
jgi:4-amino-4-deoxy-L-arabinose transferase-like glycosyltransferase